MGGTVENLGVHPETGLEVLEMQKTFKDTETNNDTKTLSPQIATEVEPPAAERKDITVADIIALDPRDLPASMPKNKKEQDPDEVVFDPESGAVKHDGLKARVDLIPPEVIFAMGEMFRHGANKYEDRNWEKGMKWSRVFGSLMRHLWAWWSGEDIDKDSNRPHLYAAACCIAMLIAYTKRKTGTDDRYISNNEQEV